MPLLFGIHNLINPERYIWTQVRILHETDKAILITAPFCHPRASGDPENNSIKVWIPKSRIYGIRLRKNIFEVYVKKSVAG